MAKRRPTLAERVPFRTAGLWQGGISSVSSRPEIGKYLVRPRLQFVHSKPAFAQCLGQTFALQQLAYTVAQLVKSLRPCEPGSVAYRLSLAPEAQPDGTDVPVRWKTLRGRGAQEGAYWSNNLTLYFKVSALNLKSRVNRWR